MGKSKKQKFFQSVVSCLKNTVKYIFLQLRLLVRKVNVEYNLGFRLGDENPLRTFTLYSGFLQALSGFYGIAQAIEYGETHVYHHHIHWIPEHAPIDGVFLDFYLETILGLCLIYSTLSNDYKKVHRFLIVYWIPFYAALLSTSSLSFMRAYLYHEATFEENFLNVVLFMTHFIHISISMAYCDHIEDNLLKIGECEIAEPAGIADTKTKVSRHSQRKKSCRYKIRGNLIQRFKRLRELRR